MSMLYRFRPDEFTIAMLSTVVLAFLLPCRGVSAGLFEYLTGVAIALLFFLQGARLPRATITAGAVHWRLRSGNQFRSRVVNSPWAGGATTRTVT
jgi:solute carrier family 10 (sodium/bile acid cotransporter), member 7